MQSSNPVFSNAPTLKRLATVPATPTVGQLEDIYRTPRALTMDDVVMRTGLLLGIVLVTGALAWVGNLSGAAVGVAGFAGLALGFVNVFKRQVSPPLVLAYAACEGVFVGGVSHLMNNQYHGIALQAAVGTSAIFGAVLWGYTSGKLRATPRFTKMVVGGFVGMFALLMVNMLMVWIGHGTGLGLRSGGPMSILFSVAFIAVGSMTFVLDFDQAQRMVEARVDERESWRVAFGLVVGLVWLYLEVLRLLSYLNRR